MMEQIKTIDLEQLGTEGAAEDFARVLEAPATGGERTRWTDDFAASGKSGKNP